MNQHARDEQIRRTLTQFTEAWNAADLDRLMTFMAPNCVYGASVGPEPGATFEGMDQVRAGFEAMLAYDAPLQSRPGRLYAINGLGVAEWAYWDKKQESLVRGCDLIEFEGAKIRRKDAFRKTLTPHVIQGLASMEKHA